VGYRVLLTSKEGAAPFTLPITQSPRSYEKVDHLPLPRACELMQGSKGKGKQRLGLQGPRIRPAC
jgi:hypothetical protein